MQDAELVESSLTLSHCMPACDVAALAWRLLDLLIYKYLVMMKCAKNVNSCSIDSYNVSHSVLQTSSLALGLIALAIIDT